MTAKQKQKSKPSAPPAQPYRLWLWLVFFVGALILLPNCLDRYLVPRFFFLSIVLLAAVWALRKLWISQGDWRWTGFELLLLAWYGINLASIGWAFSGSEAVFYSQKVLLLLAVYAVVRQAWLHDEKQTRQSMAQITQALTLVISVVLLIQFGLAVSEHGLDNQHLYDYASGVSGNKGLAADFLFFLLVFQFLFYEENRNKWLPRLSIGVLLLFILLLQTRTVYLALGAAGLFYISLRTLFEPAFRPVFLKKLLPGLALSLGLLAALIAWKGQGTTLAERLNPATYQESASALERRFTWYKTDELNKDHYWLGVGNGCWKFLFPSKSIEGAYRLQEQSIIMTRVHNDYLEVRAEMGMLGAVLFVLLFAAAFLAAGLALGQTAEPQVRHALLCLLAGLLGYCVIQYFDFPRERIELQAILAFLFASLFFYSRSVWEKGPVVDVQKFSGGIIAVLGIGLAFNVWVAWQRIEGELQTVKILKAQGRGDFPGMLNHATKASNRFYKYNDVALPLSWYEGIALYQMDRVPEAVAAFERAYRLNPWAFQVINNYGSALVRAGKYPEAIALFKEALTINPRYDEGKFNIAYSYYAQGKYDLALDWLQRVDTIPNPKTPGDRAKNQAVLQQKAGLETAIIKQRK